MVHCPAATKVTVLPDTVQTPCVDDVNATLRLDDALATRANGAVPITRSGNAENVID